MMKRTTSLYERRPFVGGFFAIEGPSFAPRLSSLLSWNVCWCLRVVSPQENPPWYLILMLLAPAELRAEVLFVFRVIIEKLATLTEE